MEACVIQNTRVEHEHDGGKACHIPAENHPRQFEIDQNGQAPDDHIEKPENYHMRAKDIVEKTNQHGLPGIIDRIIIKKLARIEIAIHHACGNLLSQIMVCKGISGIWLKGYPGLVDVEEVQKDHSDQPEEHAEEKKPPWEYMIGDFSPSIIKETSSYKEQNAVRDPIEDIKQGEEYSTKVNSRCRQYEKCEHQRPHHNPRG